MWMLAVYAAVYKWHIQPSENSASEARFVSLTGAIGLSIAVIASGFAREILWFSVATLAANIVVTSYIFIQLKSTEQAASDVEALPSL